MSAVVADKAFDANTLLEVIAAMKGAAVIPPKTKFGSIDCPYTLEN